MLDRSFEYAPPVRPPSRFVQPLKPDRSSAFASRGATIAGWMGLSAIGVLR